MAEIGIILLLFGVGLETDVRRLLNAGSNALLVAFAGFFFPLVAGYGLAYWVFGFDLLVSLFIGGTLTATSIGITVRVLADLGRQHSREGAGRPGSGGDRRRAGCDPASPCCTSSPSADSR